MTSETKANPFGFEGLNDGDGLDLAAFAPKSKPVDREKAAATREVARETGFTRRAASPAAAEPRPAPARAMSAAAPAPTAVVTSSPERGRKRRVNITELLGIQDRYPESERAQLNMLAPVPVVLRWRDLVRQGGDLPAWEILERAMDALEAQARAGKGKA
jgi:F420-dependent methylenetetrahydromethanopterin dehydrogenase